MGISLVSVCAHQCLHQQWILAPTKGMGTTMFLFCNVTSASLQKPTLQTLVHLFFYWKVTLRFSFTTCCSSVGISFILTLYLQALSMKLRICCLDPQQKKGSVLSMKINRIRWWRSISGRLGECRVASSLTLLAGPFWAGVRILVRVPSLSQIDLFKN